MSEFEKLKLDYEQTTRYFLHLSEVRFKLLGFLPLITGIAVATLPQMGNAIPAFGIALLGLTVTVGITIYDQRNTQIYDRLQKRAKFLEEKLGFPPHRITRRELGGAFQDRPGRRLVIIWHDLGLNLIYSASISAWTYLVLLEQYPFTNGAAQRQALSSTFSVFFVTFLLLMVLAVLNDWERYIPEAELSKRKTSGKAGGASPKPAASADQNASLPGR